MKNIFLSLAAIVAFIVGSTLFAQSDVNTSFYAGEPVYFGKILDVDSAEVLFTKKFDISLINGQSSIYFNANYTTTGTTSDTVRAILQGYDPASGNWANMDSILVVGSTGTSYTQSTLSISGNYAGEVRLRLEEKSSSSDNDNDGTFEWSLRANAVDVIPPKTNIGN